jgi:hypothetical protein
MNAYALDLLIDDSDWQNYRCLAGDSSWHIPDLIRRLVASTTHAQAKEIYSQLDNTVVLQGSLFEVAAHVVAPLAAALSTEISPAAREFTCELLCEIALGEPHESEVDHGNTGLAERCKDELRKGLWTYYALQFDDNPRVRASLLYIVGAVDTSPTRVTAFAESKVNDTDQLVRRAAADELKRTRGDN